MLGNLGLLVAIGLLIYLAYKGVAAIPASLLCSLVVLVTNGIPVWQGFSEFYIGGFSYFAGTYFLVFVSSALFAKAMADSGAAQTVAYKFLEWFGAERAVFVLILTTAVLTYGGVSLYVVVFVLYPISLVLLSEADLPKRMLPGILAFGAATFTMTSLPNSPQLSNVVPSQVLGTKLTAAPLLGIFASILMIVGGYFYFNRFEKKMREQKIGFVPGPNDDMSKYKNVDKEKLPGAFVSFLPLIIIFAAIILIRDIFQPLELVVYAMLISTAVIFIIHWNRMPNKKQTINQGLKDGIAIVDVAVIIGFGFVVQNSPAFQNFVSVVLGLEMNPYMSAVLITEAMAGITGSSSGALTIFLNALGEQYVQLGADPSVLHRLAAIASGGLDTLPHAGGIFILLGVTGQNHKEAYGPIFWTTVVIPVVVVLICTVITIAVY